MPYASKRELPPAVKKLPGHAQSIYRKAFNAAFEEYGEERAHAIAWSAVKKSYVKKEGRWMAKKDAFPPKEEEEGDVCDPESDAYDADACKEKKSASDAFPVEEEEETEYEFEECDPESDLYDEDECKRLTEEAEREETGDSVRIIEDAILDRGSLRMTADGYLVAQARVARTGIQLYHGDEVGDPRPTVRVYRPEKSVFARDSLHSFGHKPVTVGHPPEMVNAHNWKDYAVGHVDGEIVRDGDMVRVPMMITDASAIEAIRGGASQLSVGYDARLEIVDGKTEAGEAYDAIQHDIRVNHIALTPAARGGPQLRLGDRKGERTMERASMTRTLTVDGIEVKLPEQAAAIVSAGLKKLRDQIVNLTTEKDRLTGRVAALSRQVKDSTISDADLDKRVADRQQLVAAAQKVLGATWQPDGKASTDIRREVVTKALGDEVATPMADAAIEGAFAAVTASASDSTRELAIALAKPGSGGGSKPNAEAAWEERGKLLREAWKTNNGSMVTRQ